MFSSRRTMRWGYWKTILRLYSFIGPSPSNRVRIARRYLNQFVDVQEGFCSGLAWAILKTWSLSPVWWEVHLGLTEHEEQRYDYKQNLHFATHSETKHKRLCLSVHQDNSNMGQPHLHSSQLFLCACAIWRLPHVANGFVGWSRLLLALASHSETRSQAVK
jgi:hypothetical protein